MTAFTAAELESMPRASVVAWDADEFGVVIRDTDGSRHWRVVRRGYAVRPGLYGTEERIDFTYCEHDGRSCI